MEVAESLKISLSRPNYPSVPTWWVVSDFAFPDAPWAVSSLLGTGDLKGEKEHNHNKMNNNHKNNTSHHKNNTSLPRRKARAKKPQQPKILGSRTKESHRASATQVSCRSLSFQIGTCSRALRHTGFWFRGGLVTRTPTFQR